MHIGRHGLDDIFRVIFISNGPRRGIVRGYQIAFMGCATAVFRILNKSRILRLISLQKAETSGLGSFFVTSRVLEQDNNVFFLESGEGDQKVALSGRHWKEL
jgi:hypothetical protein